MHKDEIELCMKQAEYFARRWDGRRNFEWRMSLAIWAILAAGIRFLPELHNFRWWLPLVPVVLHSLWVYGIWKANWIDKEQGRYFQDHAQKFLMHPGQLVHWDHLPDKVPGPTRLKRANVRSRQAVRHLAAGVALSLRYFPGGLGEYPQKTRN